MSRAHKEPEYFSFRRRVDFKRSTEYVGGRIIGDYRRVALYGVDCLIEEKKQELEALDVDEFTEEVIREREEIHDQIIALEDLKKMAARYGFDIFFKSSNAII